MELLVRCAPFVLTFIAFVLVMIVGNLAESFKLGFLFNVFIGICLSAIPIFIYIASRLFFDSLL